MTVGPTNRNAAAVPRRPPDSVSRIAGVVWSAREIRAIGSCVQFPIAAPACNRIGRPPAASIWEHAVRDFRCPMSGVNRRITMNTQRSGHKDETQRDKKTTERSPHSGQKDEGSRDKHEARQEPKEQNRPTERRS